MSLPMLLDDKDLLIACFVFPFGHRMLEDGLVDESDKKKDEVEETQRELRKHQAKKGEHQPRFFK